jgi:hypothetical protein
MKGWLATVAVLLAVYALLPLVAALRGDLREWRSFRAAARVVRRLRRRPAGDADVVPLRRPLEQVSADLRRIHAAFHGGGMRFAKYEGCHQAYDRVLAEAADMMGTSHLLSLLPPGDELDRERARVEMLLRDHGLLPPLWAA